jgi:hypothetical protein
MAGRRPRTGWYSYLCPHPPVRVPQCARAEPTQVWPRQVGRGSCFSAETSATRFLSTAAKGDRGLTQGRIGGGHLDARHQIPHISVLIGYWFVTLTGVRFRYLLPRSPAARRSVRMPMETCMSDNTGSRVSDFMTRARIGESVFADDEPPTCLDIRLTARVVSGLPRRLHPPSVKRRVTQRAVGS